MSDNYYDTYQNLPRFSDDFFGQFLRALGKSYTQCADVGECFITLNKIKDDDFNSWFSAWNEIASHLQALADESWNKKHVLTAAMTYLRAVEYHRTSEFFLRANMDDPRILPCFDNMRYCFEKSIDALHPGSKPVEIPYGDTFLSGYLFTTDKNPRATLIVPGGYDSSVEEQYPLVPTSLQHGYNILIFDGPGQGHVLRRQKLTMRHDFEQVISKVLDWMDTRGDLSRLPYVLIGRSFGGYLAPRAACFEPRVAGLICDPGQIDISAVFHKILPAKINSLLDQGQQDEVNVYFNDIFSKNKMQAFYFTSRMNVHGLKTPYEYLQEMKQYRFTDVVQQIKCPTLVCDNPSDKISNRGNALYDALDCDKTYAGFSGQWGAGMHCEADATGQFLRVAFDWLDEKYPTLS